MIGKVLREQQEMMDEHKWMCHYVMPEKGEEYINLHTHGLLENFNHRDFQIVIPVDQGTGHSILSDLVERVKRGERIQVDKKYSDVIQDFDVYFSLQKEMDRYVLRMILPDPNGKFPEDEGCDPFYQKQETYKTK